jgi:Fe2+ transport system protein FeoA
MARAAELVRAGLAGEWLVPLWHMAVQPTADIVQGATEIAVDTTVADFRVGDAVAIAVDGREASLVEIVSVGADRLNLAEPLGALLPAANLAPQRFSIAPVRAASLSATIEIVRRRQNDGMVRATFVLRDAPNFTTPAMPSYLGRPVQTDPSLTRSPITVSLHRSVEYVDNGFGPVVLEPLRDQFERGETITLKAQGATKRWALRRWLWSLRGRQTSFWLPTWGRELQLRAAMTSGSTLMRAVPIADIADYAGRAILLEMPSGLRFRTITAAVTEGADHRLTLSSNLGDPVAINTRVHFLTLVRSDADRIEIRHGAVASEVTLPVVEVSE